MPGALIAYRSKTATRDKTDWDAWQRMSRNRCFGQQMAKLYYIRRGDHAVYGLFDADSVDIPAAREHQRRFKTCGYIPNLDGYNGIYSLINFIINML